MLAYEYKLQTQYFAAGEDRSIPAIGTFAIPSRSAKLDCRDFSATFPRSPGILTITLIVMSYFPEARSSIHATIEYDSYTI
jgi:hypothetical protein